MLSAGIHLGRSAAAVMAVAVMGVVFPAVASASTASISGATLYIQGGTESNNISFGGNSFLQKYIVDRAGITAGPGCTQIAPTEVECDDSFYSQMAISLGPGDDTVALGIVSFTPATVYGDAGNDTIYGTEANDHLYGGDGNDYLIGNGGNDYVDGGPGDDTVKGGANDDQVVGGPGRDSLYGDGPEVLDDGNDTINAVDGETDQIECGFGADSVDADVQDIAASSCEVVHRSDTSTPKPTPTHKPLIVLAAPAKVRLATLFRKGYRFGIDCLYTTSFRTALVVRAATAKKLGFGRKDVTITKFGSRIKSDVPYSVSLYVTNAKYRRLLAKAKSVRVDLTVRAAGAGGATTTTRHLIFSR